MSASPFFSVITATFKRGNLIKPTIESVLDQSEQDFEYLVVGDGCTDETEAAVRGFNSDKIRWLNLPENRGSQSFANNHGISAARGKWICYLGHDDLWSPDHLRSFRELIERDREADFVVAGLVDWGPPDSGWLAITGIFDSSDAVATNFTPPSSIAHRREAIARSGGWSDPFEIVLPVDSDFLLRAYEAGMRFVSTKQVTVHKFTAALRYLAYLRPDDAEQRAALAMLRASTMPASDALIAEAKKRELFLFHKHAHTNFKPGERHLRMRHGKGLRLPPLQPLEGETVIKQDAAMRAGDWEGTAEEQPATRRSWMNPRPKILIPYSGGAADFSIEVAQMPAFRDGGRLRVLVNDSEVETKFKPSRTGGGLLSFRGELAADNYTIVSLLIAPPLLDPAPRIAHAEYDRIVVGDVRLRPAKRGLLEKILASLRFRG